MDNVSVSKAIMMKVNKIVQVSTKYKISLSL